MCKAVTVRLENPQETRRFAESLACAVCKQSPGAVFFHGGLGAGKTTFIRSMVSALPGGAEADVGSPSFTICNIYCTAPPVHHYDLYRLGMGTADEALLDSLDDASVLTLVEWAEYLSPEELQDGLLCKLAFPHEGHGASPGDFSETRVLTVSALGKRGEKCLMGLQFSSPISSKE